MCTLLRIIGRGRPRKTRLSARVASSAPPFRGTLTPAAVAAQPGKRLWLAHLTRFCMEWFFLFYRKQLQTNVSEGGLIRAVR